MHFYHLLSCTILALVAEQGTVIATRPLRVVTYNVRYDSMPDNITVQETIDSLPKSLPEDPTEYYPDTSEKPWSTRRIHVANDILLRDPDIYCGQELLNRQVLDFQELLGDQYGWLGVGRDDGKDKGEYAAIFYNRNSVQVQEWDTFWLTDTPFDVSKYPDAGSYRVATTAHFVGQNGPFTVINTHLDDQSDGQRKLGVSLILHRARFEAITTGRPVVITGDFNSPTSDGAYQIITGAVPPVAINETFAEKYCWPPGSGGDDLVLTDILGVTPPYRRSGDYATFTDFATVADFSNYKRIDYIFANSNGGWAAEAFHVGANLYDDGIYASDHRPVYADLSVNADSDRIEELKL